MSSKDLQRDKQMKEILMLIALTTGISVMSVETCFKSLDNQHEQNIKYGEYDENL